MNQNREFYYHFSIRIQLYNLSQKVLKPKISHLKSLMILLWVSYCCLFSFLFHGFYLTLLYWLENLTLGQISPRGCILEFLVLRIQKSLSIIKKCPSKICRPKLSAYTNLKVVDQTLRGKIYGLPATWRLAAVLVFYNVQPGNWSRLELLKLKLYSFAEIYS